ncbi:MAG: hypothetical protein M1142_03895 [Patescibacteria group bacterium]|nr:hypothetical protein [Patescibacteria group bacterium]
MQTTIENQAYRPPEQYNTLANSWIKKDLLTLGSFNNLPQIAEELGFSKTTDIPTKKSRWQIFNRPDYDVPNFPDGSTRINSTLAVYGIDEGLIHAILRTSPESYPTEEFEKDLAAFTKHYIERPRLLGFPSKELTTMRNVLTSVFVGTATLSVVDYYTINSMHAAGIIPNIGSILGEIGGPSIYGTLWALSERHARRQISHPEQYVAGDTVRSTLQNERSHNIRVDSQRELYQALQQEGADLSPDQFLETIYDRIPDPLIDQRYKEIEQIKYPKPDVSTETSNSLPKLLEASHVLLSIESYRNSIHQLEQGLAKL